MYGDASQAIAGFMAAFNRPFGFHCREWLPKGSFSVEESQVLTRDVRGEFFEARYDQYAVTDAYNQFYINYFSIRRSLTAKKIAVQHAILSQLKLRANGLAQYSIQSQLDRVIATIARSSHQKVFFVDVAKLEKLVLLHEAAFLRRLISTLKQTAEVILLSHKSTIHHIDKGLLEEVSVKDLPLCCVDGCFLFGDVIDRIRQSVTPDKELTLLCDEEQEIMGVSDAIFASSTFAIHSPHFPNRNRFNINAFLQEIDISQQIIQVREKVQDATGLIIVDANDVLENRKLAKQRESFLSLLELVKKHENGSDKLLFIFRGNIGPLYTKLQELNVCFLVIVDNSLVLDELVNQIKPIADLDKIYLSTSSEKDGTLAKRSMDVIFLDMQQERRTFYERLSDTGFPSRKFELVSNDWVLSEVALTVDQVLMMVNFALTLQTISLQINDFPVDQALMRQRLLWSALQCNVNMEFEQLPEEVLLDRQIEQLARKLDAQIPADVETIQLFAQDYDGSITAAPNSDAPNGGDILHWNEMYNRAKAKRNDVIIILITSRMFYTRRFDNVFAKNRERLSCLDGELYTGATSFKLIALDELVKRVNALRQSRALPPVKFNILLLDDNDEELAVCAAEELVEKMRSEQSYPHRITYENPSMQVDREKMITYPYREYLEDFLALPFARHVNLHARGLSSAPVSVATNAMTLGRRPIDEARDAQPLIPVCLP